MEKQELEQTGTGMTQAFVKTLRYIRKEIRLLDNQLTLLDKRLGSLPTQRREK